MRVASAFMAVWLGLGLGATLRAEGPPEQPEEAKAASEQQKQAKATTERPEETVVLDLKLKVFQGHAEKEALEKLGTLLDARAKNEEPEAGREAHEPGNLPLPDRVWETIEKELKKTHDERTKALNTLEKDWGKSQEGAIKAWRKVALDSIKLREQHARAEKRLEMPLGAGEQPPFWDRSMLLIVCWGMVAICGGLLLTLHEARGRVRWTLRSLGSQAALFLLAVACATLGFGCDGWLGGDGGVSVSPEEGAILEAERKQLQDDLKVLEPEIESAEEGVNDKLGKALLRRFPTAKTATAADPSARERENVRRMEADAQGKMRDLFVLAWQTKALVDDVDKQSKILVEDGEKLKNSVNQIRTPAWYQGAVRVALCVGFAGLAFFPLRRARRRHLQQLHDASQQCPRCLETGNLESISTEVQDSEDNELNVLACSDCQYIFRESYQFVPRICFPTVGVRASGKTLWLLTAYEMIRNSNIPVPATLTNVPSLDKDKEEQFENQIKITLEQHGETEATDLGLPAPLTFYLKDRDPFGREELLLNMFDFSGEVMFRELAMDSIRRRALLFDGFILFLDPTQVRGGPTSLNITDQIKSLMKFKEEMRAVRGVALGQPIDVPIAVCISKLDMLVTKNPMEGLSRDLIGKLRATMFDPVNLQTIHKRSSLCAQALPMMFPGWQIERDLRENFGGRFMFFPLTPVGLEEAELGVEDLKHRNFAPFGILEPILWLFHMHGYCVFG